MTFGKCNLEQKFELPLQKKEHRELTRAGASQIMTLNWQLSGMIDEVDNYEKHVKPEERFPRSATSLLMNIFSALAECRGGCGSFLRICCKRYPQMKKCRRAGARLLRKGRIDRFATVADVVDHFPMGGPACSSLVKSPVRLLRASKDALRVVTFGSSELRLKRIPNSVDTLAPTSRFVKAINTIPITPSIPYHTIMGDRGRGDAPNSSDGVVPYWSSHMEGAKSELIVPSGHSAHQNPKAIQEVRRILMLNAENRNRGKAPANDP
ncbi:MAG: hypothetical protein WB586_03225 [Chthoniobacterales bacterium]